MDKIECEVKRVEVARGVRLCKSSAEPFLFKVPRVKVSNENILRSLSTIIIEFVLFQMDYFQDDIYPETRVKWEPAVTAEEWFAGKNGTQNFISLQPEGMKLCKQSINVYVRKSQPTSISLQMRVHVEEFIFVVVSEAPKLAPPPKKYTYDFKAKTDEEKKEELVSAMIDRMAERDQEPLPQDAQEGVADDEWVNIHVTN